MRSSLIILLFLLTILSGCSRQDQGESIKREEFEMPDIILNDTKYTLSTGEGEPILIEAKEMKVFLNEDKVLVSNLTFSQKDDEGNDYITGSAYSGTINTKDKICSFSGRTSLKQHIDNLSIEAESLTFDSRDNTFSAKGNVSVSFPGGYIEGRDLFANLTRMDLELREINKGEVDN